MYNRLFNSVDFIVVPIILVLIIAVLNIIKRKQPLELQDYFFKGYCLRIFGTFSLTAVVQYIFQYGDTFNYYNIIQTISSFFAKNPGAWLDIMLKDPSGDNPNVLACVNLLESGNFAISAIIFKIPENLFICKIGSIINIICFNSYLGIGLFFGIFSFLGCWYIFKTFIHIFPGYEKEFAWFCLYLPSLWFWCNGILKDPLSIFALGLLVYNFFVKQRSLLYRGVVIMLSVYLLLQIKSYIFYAFAMASVLALIVVNFKGFNIIGKLISIFFVAISLIFIYPLVSEFVSNSFENITNQSQFFIEQYSSNITEGDSTIIPVYDPSVFGFLKLCLGGLVTVFLRPFPWELNKITYIFLILENLLLYVIIFKSFKTGPLEFKKNHIFLANFCIFYFIFLGMIIGVTTFNLGTIARYRAPALPFLFAGIYCIKLVNKRKNLNKHFKL